MLHCWLGNIYQLVAVMNQTIKQRNELSMLDQHHRVPVMYETQTPPWQWVLYGAGATLIVVIAAYLMFVEAVT